MEDTLSLVGEGDLDGTTGELEEEEDSAETMELARRTLVGKILTNKPLNKGVVKSILLKVWGDPLGLKITGMGPNVRIYVHLCDKREVVEVMKKSPWLIMNHLIDLQFWTPEASVFEIDYARVSSWVQLHDMPLGTMDKGNAMKIMEKMGEVENPLVEGNLLRSFMRVRMKMDIQKLLPTGCGVGA